MERLATASTRARPAAADASPSRGRVLAGLLSAAAIVVLDFFIVLACLPPIAETLGASKAQLQLILAAYAVANASLLVVGGRLGDVFGRRKTMLRGVALFAAASLACGLATSATWLIAFRAAQGLAGAMVQPQVLGLLAVNFPPQERARVFGLYAGAMGCASIAAQLLGGLLVGLLPVEIGWRSCFVLSVPLCIVSIALAHAVGDGEPARTKRVDGVGALIIGLGMGCVCTVLTTGREQGWPAWTFAALAVGAACPFLLLTWQTVGKLSGDERIIPHGMLTHQRFWLSLLTIFVFYAGIASLYFVLALELRIRNGYSAVQTGLLFGVLAACFVITSTLRPLRRAVGTKWADVGVVGVLLGHAAMFGAGSYLTYAAQGLGFVASAVLLGGGIGCLMGPLTAHTLSKVRAHQASVGGGIATATQQIGNSTGIAAIGFAYFGVAPEAPTSLGGAVVYLAALMAAVFGLVQAARPKGSAAVRVV